jgi:transcriptional regulator with XRE-family HTH domain
MAKARRHHNADDIEAKLRHADGMAASGRTQKEISQALGISVMTYHRWRRSRASHAPESNAVIEFAAPAQGAANSPAPTRISSSPAQMSGLLLENERLRRLVTNLLLEKIALQERMEPQRYGLRGHDS